MAAPKTLVGTLIDGRYEILEQIATGGVGVVYKARRVELERIVALKLLHEELLKEKGLIKRFQVEAVALSRLDHPHCVAVKDLGLYKGRPYLVLEYVPGKTVTELIHQGGRFEPRRAIHVTLQILETLEHFHQQHIVHRDLKAENVMLMESSNEPDFVKVLDFGMAKILKGRGADSQLSNLGIVPGTPSAMAPEQIQQLPPDPRIDIYATGILLYEMVVGHRPFRGADHAKVVKDQLKTPPTPPREVLGEGVISTQLEAVILKSLEKDRYDRFGSAAEMAVALRSVPEAPPVSLPTYDTPAPTSGSSGLLVPTISRRPNWRWIGAGAAALLLLVILGLRPWASRKSAPAEPASSAAPAPSEPVAPSPSPSPAASETPAPPPPSPSPSPSPSGAEQAPWEIHRDLAVTYAEKGQPKQAFVEVLSALRDDPTKAAADPALLDAAMTWLVLPEGKSFAGKLAQSFKGNPKLVEVLVKATTNQSAAARQNAVLALSAIGQKSAIDWVAVFILDLDQAKTCSAIRSAYRHLQGVAKLDEARVQGYVTEMKARDPSDPHVKCLKSSPRRRSRPSSPKPAPTRGRW